MYHCYLIVKKSHSINWGKEFWANNEFMTCFSRILIQRIYEKFSRNFMFHFLKGCKVSFSVIKTVISAFHSMAMGNLNKSKETTPTTTTASKYIPRRTKISINWNPTFWTFFLKQIFKDKNFQKFSDRSEIFFLLYNT